MRREGRGKNETQLNKKERGKEGKGKGKERKGKEKESYIIRKGRGGKPANSSPN